MISVQRVQEFPNAPVFGSRVNSIEEAERWAQGKNADTVWVYRHKFVNNMFTAVVLVPSQAVLKVIEKVEAL